MQKRISKLILTIIGIIIASCSLAMALPPMGPPMAIYGEGQWAVGAEYGQSELDLWTFGISKEGFPPYPYTYYSAYEKYQIKALKTNLAFGTVGYGMSNSWDLYIRAGGANAEDEIIPSTDSQAGGSNLFYYDGSFAFAWGCGTRTTFHQEDNVSWGALFQITWIEPDVSSFTKEDTRYSGNTIIGNASLEFWEMQVAAGATIELENFSIYAGPFVHIVNGDFEVNAWWTDGSQYGPISCNHEIREMSQFGGYAGAQWQAAENVGVYVEGQFTSDAWGFAVGGYWGIE